MDAQNPFGQGLGALIPPSPRNNTTAPADGLRPDHELPAPPPEPVGPIVPVTAPYPSSEPVILPPPVILHAAPSEPEPQEMPQEQPVRVGVVPSATPEIVAPVSGGVVSLTPEDEQEAPSSASASREAYLRAIPPRRPSSRVVSEGGRGRMPDAVFQIEVEKIHPNPDQPRRVFDEERLKELAASIREFGLLEPIVVSKIEREVPTGTEVEYELIAGERRLMAVKLLGLPRVPAIIRNIGFDRERLELAVIENLQRENLSPIEMARAFARLQDEFRLTQREIASRLGKSREVVANTVRLLDLPPEIQDALASGIVSESHGRLLLTIEDPALQKRLFRDLVENRLTTRELRIRAEAAGAKGASGRRGNTSGLTPELKSLEERLSSELGAPVSIKSHGESGRITINFYSPEELRGIIERLGSELE